MNKAFWRWVEILCLLGCSSVGSTKSLFLVPEYSQANVLLLKVWCVGGTLNTKQRVMKQLSSAQRHTIVTNPKFTLQAPVTRIKRNLPQHPAYHSISQCILFLSMISFLHVKLALQHNIYFSLVFSSSPRSCPPCFYSLVRSALLVKTNVGLL